MLDRSEGYPTIILANQILVDECFLVYEFLGIKFEVGKRALPGNKDFRNFYIIFMFRFVQRALSLVFFFFFLCVVSTALVD